MPGTPLVVVVAGPNGAGKSTSAPRLLRDTLEVREFVNADAIALGLSAFRPEAVAITAGRVMLARINELARERADFAFETTLASRTLAPWISRLRVSGYRAHMVFLSLSSADLAVARVRDRVEMGGHGVPETVVRRRFVAGLRNFFDLYQEVVDSWQFYDNSAVMVPRIIAAGVAGEPARVLDEAAWTNLQEKRR
jgi:predicted ABC-type ATPase